MQSKGSAQIKYNQHFIFLKIPKKRMFNQSNFELESWVTLKCLTKCFVVIECTLFENGHLYAVIFPYIYSNTR